ncbi:hypothetical protein ACJ2A9_03860 [Anaerobacillus sp. MEB173]|uniref:hypothetical protein n=1 Tax=Anaerobacillus sp. MEB173 TaxID=3383345 RepID=UPI003F904AFE
MDKKSEGANEKEMEYSIDTNSKLNKQDLTEIPHSEIGQKDLGNEQKHREEKSLVSSFLQRNKCNGE